MASPKTPVLFRITDDLTLAAGKYVKAGERRIGTAFLAIDKDGNLTYTDRNGLTTPVTLTQFAAKYRAGYSTPSESAALPSKVTVAPRA